MTYVDYSNADKTRQETRALELRLLGKTYEFIGEELGVAPQTAWRRVQAALVRYAAPKAEEVRAQETARHQMVIDAAIAIASQPDTQPKDRLAALKVIQSGAEAIARLHGANAPVKIDARVQEVTQADLELEAMIREARASAAAAESSADTAATA